MEQLVVFLIGILFGRYTLEILDLWQQHISNKFAVASSKMQVELNKINSETSLEEKPKYKIGFQLPEYEDDHHDPIEIDEEEHYEEDDYFDKGSVS